jgi:glycine/D-amino acid oxidase-like deaminating enzyme
LRDGHALLDVETHVVSARRVVLCTNGFEHLHIINESGLDIDAKYHHVVSGKVGYMSGYLETLNKQPIAISYYKDAVTGMDNSYYYLTRRPFEYEQGTHHNLISIGGPDMDIDERTPYSFEDEYPEGKTEEIDAFLRSTYDRDPNKKIDFVFAWHGLMGYTTNGLRLIGPEPQNPTLLYNLGCNGVGILPSLYGGRTIARHIAGEQVPRSIFDVPKKARE